jgi:uncharacterized membrane protein YkoI
MEARMKKLLIALTVAAVVGLSGCGSEEVTATDSDKSTSDSSHSVTPDVNSVAQAVAAIRLAESEANGRAFELDSEGLSRWEINVASNEREIEVQVNQSGTVVTHTRDDGPLDPEDQDQLTNATVSMADAVSTAGESASGAVSSAELSTHMGTLAWSVEFESGTEDIEVFVDAANGKVLHIAKD